MKRTRKHITTLLMILFGGIAYAQSLERELETRYVRSLEDSLVRFELLKPIALNLEHAYVYKEKEAQSLRMQLQIMSFSIQYERASFAKQIAAEKRRKKRVLALVGLAVVTGLLIR